MHATPVREPVDRSGWIYEEKIDGWRMLAYKDGRAPWTRVQAISEQA
jgi:hypothetical protein